jgi:cell wall-associated NlpC family hydrolase
MMTTRAAVCAEARGWLGTPWVHQGHSKGVGVDCGGLVGGVAVALGIVAPDFWRTSFDRFAGYARQPSGDSLLHVLDAFMARIDPDAAQPGDVVAVSFRRDPHHVGMLVPYGAGDDDVALVHALNSPGQRCVVEHRLDERWRSRIRAAYTLPGVG